MVPFWCRGGVDALRVALLFGLLVYFWDAAELGVWCVLVVSCGVVVVVWW